MKTAIPLDRWQPLVVIAPSSICFALGVVAGWVNFGLFMLIAFMCLALSPVVAGFAIFGVLALFDRRYRIGASALAAVVLSTPMLYAGAKSSYAVHFATTVPACLLASYQAPNARYEDAWAVDGGMVFMPPNRHRTIILPPGEAPTPALPYRTITTMHRIGPCIDVMESM